MPEYELRLRFTAASSTQASRLAQAWAGTCAAEYNTRYAGFRQVKPTHEPKRVPVGTRVLTCWGPAVVTHDHWPDDPNYEITYLSGAEHRGVSIEGLTGAFTSVHPEVEVTPAPNGRYGTREDET